MGSMGYMVETPVVAEDQLGRLPCIQARSNFSDHPRKLMPQLAARTVALKDQRL